MKNIFCLAFPAVVDKLWFFLFWPIYGHRTSHVANLDNGNQHVNSSPATLLTQIHFSPPGTAPEQNSRLKLELQSSVKTCDFLLQVLKI